MTLYECLKQGFQTGDYKKAKEDWLNQNIPIRIGEFSFTQELALIDSYISTKLKIDEALFGPWVYLFRASFHVDKITMATKCLEIYHLKTALKAIKENDKQMVFDFLETKNSFKRNQKLKLLSFEAAQLGNWEILKELLEKGARLNPSFFENKEESLLMKAAQYQQKEIVYNLLQLGAKVYLKGSQKEELFKSYKRANEYQKMTELVLSYGSLLKKKKEKKEWALMHQLVSGSIGEKEIFKFLNQYPLLSMGAQNEEGKGILEEAIDNNDQNLASRALSFGVSLNGKTKEGKTFLEEALYKDRVWFFKLFNEEELKIEAQKVFKNGILNEALKNRSLEISQYLIKENILLDEQDEKGRTPLMNIYRYSMRGIDYYTFRSLLKATKDINQADLYGKTALFYAVRSARYASLVQMFELRSGEIDIDHQDHFGKTALMKGVLMNHQEIVQKLIAEGADILIQNEEGKDVFNLAMSEGNIKMANLIKREMKKKLGIVSAPKKVLLPKKKVTNWAFNAQNTKI